MTFNTAATLLSVVIPTYNRKEYLPKALKSVLDQSPEATEVIVVDDGSTDGTAQVISNFDDTRIKYVYQQNRGEGGARNQGLDLSRGKYVAFLDSDDVWWPNRVPAHLHALETNSAVDLVYGPYFEGDDKLQPQMMTVPPTRLSFEDWLEGCQFGSFSATFRSSCLNPELRANEKMPLAPDWDFWLKLFTNGCRAFYHPIPTGVVRNHIRSQTVNIAGLTEAYQILVESWLNERGVTFPPQFQRERHYSNALFALRRRQMEIIVSEIQKAIASDGSSPKARASRATSAVVNLLADPFGPNPDELSDQLVPQVARLVGKLPMSLQQIQAQAHLIRARHAFMTDRLTTGWQELASAYTLESTIMNEQWGLFIDAAIVIADYKGLDSGEQLLKQVHQAWPGQGHKSYRHNLGLYYLNLGLRSHQQQSSVEAKRYMRRALSNKPTLLFNRGLLSTLLGWSTLRAHLG